MALITRVSRLFRADFHAVLDRIEEPDVLLRQAIREMEEALASDEQRLRLLNHEQGQLVARIRELDQSLHAIEEELDICFAANKADLARALVRRKLEAQRLNQHLSRRRETLQETVSGLNKRLEENRSQLDSMRQRAELLAEDREADYPKDGWSGPDISVGDEDVEIAFLREKQKRSRQ
jgi:phage shock protein A